MLRKTAWAWLCALVVGGMEVSIGIFDAGSTGTRLNIYTFSGGEVMDVRAFRKEHGLHTLGPENAARTVQGLAVTAGVPRSLPLWFYGTAGLRTLGIESQNALLSAVATALNGYRLVEARVLTGNLEGLYTLKAFEYLSPHVPSFVLADMGGLSVQIIRKDFNHAGISSFPLGINVSKCIDSEGLAGDSVPYPLYNDQNSCVLRLFNKNGLRAISRRNAGTTIYVTSFFYDLLIENGSVLSLWELNGIFRRRCRQEKTDVCNRLFFAIKLLERLGLRQHDHLFLLKKINGLDVSWALGRAVELNRLVSSGMPDRLML